MVALILSLSLIDQKSDFFVVEIDESIFLVHSMASKIVTHKDMPVRIKFLVKKLLQILANLYLIKYLLRVHPYRLPTSSQSLDSLPL